MKIHVINLEEGRPVVDIAIKRLSSELRLAKAQKKDIVKIIHGWGSTGKGGKIKNAALLELRKYIKQGRINDYLLGEDFSPFNIKCRKYLDIYPYLKNDQDYSKNNAGITLIFNNSKCYFN